MAEFAIQTLILEPSNPGAPRGRPGAVQVFGHGANFLILEPSLVVGERNDTTREVCYAIMRPCFPPRPVGFVTPRYAASFLILEPSLAAGERNDTTREVCYAIMRPCMARTEREEVKRVTGASFLILEPSLAPIIPAIDYDYHACTFLILEPSVEPLTPEYEHFGEIGYYHG